jgi:hypothetical protein
VLGVIGGSCCAFLPLGAAYADADADADADLKSFLRSPPGSTVSMFGAQPPDSRNPIDKVVVAEFNAAVSALQQNPIFRDVNPKLSMTSDATGAHPADGVIVNREQIRRWLDDANISRPINAIKFLIAHEVVHMGQYSLYGITNYEDFRFAENRRVIEAQADMLAARYLVLSNQGDIGVNAMKEVERLVFDLGEAEVGAAQHPSPEKRRTAVRFGATLGKAQKIALATTSWDVIRAAQDAASAVGFEATSEPWLWSLVQSSKIVHAGTPYLQDLTPIAQAKIMRQVTAGTPIVHYILSYVYAGHCTAHFLLTVAAVVGSSSHADGVRIVSSAVYDFWLDPGEGKVLDGVLVADKANPAATQLLFWPQPESLAIGQLF